jgi:hypothetical protein
MALPSEKIAAAIVNKRAAHFDPKRREVDRTARLMLWMLENEVLPSQSDRDELFSKVAMLEPRVHALAELLERIKALKLKRKRMTTQSLGEFFEGYEAARATENLQFELKKKGQRNRYDEANSQISDQHDIREGTLRARRTRFRVKP